jgi:hypothetical protein
MAQQQKMYRRGLGKDRTAVRCFEKDKPEEQLS